MKDVSRQERSAKSGQQKLLDLTRLEFSFVLGVTAPAPAPVLFGFCVVLLKQRLRVGRSAHTSWLDWARLTVFCMMTVL